MKKWTLILIACLALVAAGCGDDDDSSSDSGAADTSAQTAPETTAEPEASANATGDVVKVDIKDIKFIPETINVKKGQTVEWTNSDGSIPHNVKKSGGPGPEFASENLNDGDTYEQTFDTAGTIDYLCTIHSGQTGKIVVK